jgi:hypothetical protein
MSSELSACFGWNTNPAIGIIIEQLFIITERYEDRNKPELLPVISEIYLFLAGCSDRSPEFQQLQNHKWIIVGLVCQLVYNMKQHQTKVMKLGIRSFFDSVE